MNVYSMLDTLEDELEIGKQNRLGGKVKVDKQHCLDIIRDIRMHLPSELKQAGQISKECETILMEAQKEAEAIIADAKKQTEILIQEHDITQSAHEVADEIIEDAKKTARELRLGAKDYAEEVMQELERVIQDKLIVVQKNKDELNDMMIE